MTTFVINAANSRNQNTDRKYGRKIIVGVLTTDGSDGAVKDVIKAGAFGLRVIEEVSHLAKTDETTLVHAAPSKTGLSLIGFNAAGAAANIPAGDYNVTVRGY